MTPEQRTSLQQALDALESGDLLCEITAANILANMATRPVDEQEVFEDWLAHKCPSGDHESVRRQWESSSEYLDWIADKKEQVEPTMIQLRYGGKGRWQEPDGGNERARHLLATYPGRYESRELFAHPLEKHKSRLIESATRLVEHADFQLGGALSADSKAKDIPSKAVSMVKARHLASLRDALAGVTS